MEKIESIVKWLKKGWYGVLVSYPIALVLVLGLIWAIVEPIGVSDEFAELPSFTKYRFFWHLLLAFLITSHLIIVLLVIELNCFKNDSVKTFDIKIQHLTNGDEVRSPFRISGSYKIKPPDGSVRVIERSLKSLEYWIKSEVVFNETTKQWSVENVYISGDDGEKRDILVAYFGADGMSLAKYYEKANPNPSGKIGIKQLTGDIQVCDQITVKRKI